MESATDRLHTLYYLLLAASHPLVVTRCLGASSILGEGSLCRRHNSPRAPSGHCPLAEPDVRRPRCGPVKHASTSMQDGQYIPSRPRPRQRGPAVSHRRAGIILVAQCDPTATPTSRAGGCTDYPKTIFFIQLSSAPTTPRRALGRPIPLDLSCRQILVASNWLARPPRGDLPVPPPPKLLALPRGGTLGPVVKSKLICPSHDLAHPAPKRR